MLCHGDYKKTHLCICDQQSATCESCPFLNASRASRRLVRAVVLVLQVRHRFEVFVSSYVMCAEFCRGVIEGAFSGGSSCKCA